MANTVASHESRQKAVSDAWSPFTATGSRKYLNLAERQQAMAAFGRLPVTYRLFALTLAWTGARISEVLSLTPAAIDLETGTVAVRTLKRRRLAVREIPVPLELLGELETAFALSACSRDPVRRPAPLWPFTRSTGWRVLKSAMEEAGLSGCRATPRALRHSFAVGTLRSGVPVTLVQRWLGHSKLSTTAIYADVCGPEERAFAERFWRQGGTSVSSAPPPNDPERR